MTNAPAQTQANAITTYETAYGAVTLSPEIVTNYLKRGSKSLTDQEITLFINLCKYQGLNPFVNEAYMIKFGDQASMVIGYDAYKRRAYENPDYKGKKSGIVVLRGENVVCKEGTCLYPSETLLGGWCRVSYIRNGQPAEEYREVSLKEFDKGNANWKSMPCTMIEKVAVSQCLRAAFPKDFAGLYTAEEMPGTNDAPPPDFKNEQPEHTDPVTGEIDNSPLVTTDQRKIIFDRAKMVYGGEGVEKVKAYCKEHGFESTTALTLNAYNDLLKKINADLDASLQVKAEGEVK